jgi:hypothetical protein
VILYKRTTSGAEHNTNVCGGQIRWRWKKCPQVGMLMA